MNPLTRLLSIVILWTVTCALSGAVAMILIGNLLPALSFWNWFFVSATVMSMVRGANIMDKFSETLD